jgi:dimethylamine/trimethylamine dehydrogenase
VFTPEDVFAGATLASPVLIYDDDHYYMAGALAEKLRRQGLQVHLATPAAKVSEFTDMTMEQHRIQSGLLAIGVTVHTSTEIAGIAHASDGLDVALRSVYADATQQHSFGSLVLVTMRDPVDDVFTALQARESEWQAAGILSVQLVGDALAPGTVAAAVYAGHSAARALNAPALAQDEVPFKRELIALE